MNNLISNVRVRFAPSPTGYLHIGGLRTAFFNWLFAKNMSGKYLLRIEDTDLLRSKQEYTDCLIEALAWFGIESDEDLVFQSKRFDVYKSIAIQLLNEKKAYRCVCSDEEFRFRLSSKTGESEFFKYDRHCFLKQDEIIKNNLEFGVRFLIPDGLFEIEFQDSIRGQVKVMSDQLDDFVILRKDGIPTYNFAVVVDDNFWKITHVIRGEDHVSNTPKQILIYKALNYEIPMFAHIPMILAPDGSRLSKRNSAVDALEYKRDGFLAEALLNYIVRLGWSHGDQEIFSIEELIKSFSLENVGKKASIFDMQKLLWLNGIYIRSKTDNELLELLKDFDIDFDNNLRKISISQEKIYKAISLYKDRSKTLVELKKSILILLSIESIKYDLDDVKKFFTQEIKEKIILLNKQFEDFADFEDFSSSNLNNSIKDFCLKNDLKLVSIAQPLRLALTGTISSPGIFEMLEFIGKSESLKRIHLLISQF